MSLTAPRIRMYRVGFGDCFLVTLPAALTERTTDAHILIDCGVHSNGTLGNLREVVANVAEVTGRRLTAIVATHAHQDHIAGFARCADLFRSFEIQEVWLPWTEDPNDHQATRIRLKQEALTTALAPHIGALAARQPADSAERAELNAAAAVVANLSGNETALQHLRSGFGSTATVRYLEAGARLTPAAGVSDLSVQVLGPPRDQAFLARMDPPTGQRYLSGEGEDSWLNATTPFGPRWVRDSSESTASPEFDSVRMTKAERERVQVALASPSMASLAFALDQARNNSSLVLLLSFRGYTMLFPGDAQYGSWQWWIEKLDGQALLADVDFLKVAHHGSHNASPRRVIESLESLQAVMVPTQTEPWDSIPRLPLLDALEARAPGHVVRSDSLTIASSPNAPQGPPIAVLGDGFTQGAFWYDYSFSGPVG